MALPVGHVHVPRVELECAPPGVTANNPTTRISQEVEVKDGPESSGTDGRTAVPMEEAVMEHMFFKDGRCVEVCDGGDAMMTFDLREGQQWRKRVWPRRDFPKNLMRWNSVEEILSYLISFERHAEWITTQVPYRSPSGSIMFFDRSETKKYRNDAYDWKTRKTMSTVREDRMKLKVGGCQLLYGCYAHSASNPKFHRRTYWLIQNPNLIMVHYLDSKDYLTSSALKNKNPSSNLDPTLTPTNWSMLTISDCNLCALLDMTKEPDTIKVLLHQLKQVLGSNLRPGSSLDDVLVTNNTGLPVDMFEDCRTKKHKGIANKKDLMSSSYDNHVCKDVDMDALSSSLSSGEPSGNAQVLEGGEGLESLEALKVLSKSPHLIMSYHNKGSINCILTLPTAGGGPRLLPRQPRMNGAIKCSSHPNVPCPSSSSVFPSTLSSSSSPSTSLSVFGVNGGGSFQNTGFLGKKKVESKQGSSRKGKKLSQDERENILNQLQKVVNGLIQPLDHTPSSVGRTSSSHGGGSDTNKNVPAFVHQDPSLPENASASMSSSLLPLPLPGTPSILHPATPPTPLLTTTSTPLLTILPTTSHTSLPTTSHTSLPTTSHTPLPTTSHTPLPTTSPTSPVTPHSSSLRSDYDAEKFSEFADSLARMDHVESFFNFPNEESTGGLKDGQNGCVQSMTSDLTDILQRSSSLCATMGLTLLEGQSAMGLSDGELDASFDDSADSRLPNIPLSWLCGGEEVTVANGIMEDVLMEPSTAAELYRLQENSSGTFGGGLVLADSTVDQSEQNTLFMDNCNLDPYSLKLNLDTTGWQQFLHQAGPVKPLNGTSPNDVTNPTYPNMFAEDFIPCEHMESTEYNSNEEKSQSAFNAEPPSPVDHNGLTPAQTSALPPSSISHMDITSSGCNPSSWNGLWQNNDGLDPVKDWHDSTPQLPTSSATTTCSVASVTIPTQSTTLHQQLHYTSPIDSNLTSFPNDSVLPQDFHNLIFKSSVHTTISQPQPPCQPAPLSNLHNNLSTHNQIPAVFHPSHSISPHQVILPGSPTLATSQYSDFSSNSSNSYLQLNTCNNAVRKISNVSIHSEPPLGGEQLELGLPPPGCSPPSHHPHHLSLPDLAMVDVQRTPHVQEAATPTFIKNLSTSAITGGVSGLASPVSGLLPANPSTPNSRNSISPSPLQDIPEGIRIELGSSMEESCADFWRYGTNSPPPSSPSAASVSSSAVSVHDLFEESPSVRELCEMMSESPNVQQADFSNMTLTDVEQDQLFHAAEIIQGAFRKFTNRRQLMSKEKSAALLIENYYKKYREAMEQKDKAARRIQNQYRIYKRRTRELDRTTTFIQQMYRSKTIRSSQLYPYHRPHDSHPAEK